MAYYERNIKDEVMLAAINLLNTIMESSDLQKEAIARALGSITIDEILNLYQRTMLLLHAGGADDKLVKNLVKAQNELSLELIDEYTHYPTVLFFYHNFFACYNECMMSKQQNDAKMVRMTAMTALGSHSIIKPKIFGKSPFRRRKRSLVDKEPHYLEDQSGEEKFE